MGKANPIPAAALDAWEQALSAAGGPSGAYNPAALCDAQRRIVSSINGAKRTASRWEDPAVRAAILETIPMDALAAAAKEIIATAEAAAEADSSASAKPVPSPTEALTRAALRWFKHDFFTWFDKPKACVSCGSKHGEPGWREFTYAGDAQPTSFEASVGDASRAEAYACGSCGSRTTFARLNNPAVLVKNAACRRGRCGEWANAFGAILRALSLHARYVVDLTDHVWVEVWDSGTLRWVHADACENSYDEPLLYSDGWGKKLTWVFAVGVECPGSSVGVTSPIVVADVTARYVNVSKWAECLGRRSAVSEQWVAAAVVALGEAHSALTPIAAARAHSDAVAIATIRRTAAAARGPHAASVYREPPQAPQPPATQLPGRTTGSAEWRAARGETGTPAAAAAADAAASSPPTSSSSAPRAAAVTTPSAAPAPAPAPTAVPAPRPAASAHVPIAALRGTHRVVGAPWIPPLAAVAAAAGRGPLGIALSDGLAAAIATGDAAPVTAAADALAGAASARCAAAVDLAAHAVLGAEGAEFACATAAGTRNRGDDGAAARAVPGLAIGAAVRVLVAATGAADDAAAPAALLLATGRLAFAVAVVCGADAAAVGAVIGAVVRVSAAADAHVARSEGATEPAVAAALHAASCAMLVVMSRGTSAPTANGCIVWGGKGSGHPLSDPSHVQRLRQAAADVAGTAADIAVCVTDAAGGPLAATAWTTVAHGITVLAATLPAAAAGRTGGVSRCVSVYSVADDDPVAAAALLVAAGAEGLSEGVAYAVALYAQCAALTQ